MSMRYSSRLFLYLPFVLLIVLAIAAMLRWWVVAGTFERWLLHANGREIAPGIRLRFASEEMGGFPFRVDTVLSGLALEANCARASVSWRAERFAIHSLIYGRAQKIFEAAGAQTLSWTMPEGGARRLVFTPGSLRASAILSEGVLARFDLDLAGFGSREVSGARAQLHLRRAPSRDTIDIAISAEALRLAPELQAEFGPEIPHMVLVGRIAPAAPFSPFLSGRGPWCAALDKWRGSAGSFRLDRLDMAWGQTSAEGSGRLTLDDLHRPQGALQLKVAQTDQTSTPPAREARLSRALGRLARATRSTGEVPLEVSAAFNNGAVTLRHAHQPYAESAGSFDALY
ncbi:MAG TPA: DUF2125 domain-containing protein [Rhizomicrobium sp.]|jgi:hypothetical protein|nr:DUF2125 domain-containing protein [Rhizomicrobium sp.]